MTLHFYFHIKSSDSSSVWQSTVPFAFIFTSSLSTKRTRRLPWRQRKASNFMFKLFFPLNDSASCKYALIIFPWLRVSRLTNPFSFKCTLTVNSLFRILTCLTKINLDTKIAIRKRIVNPKIREKKIGVAATDRTGAEGRGYSLRKISVVMAILIQIKLHS